MRVVGYFGLTVLFLALSLCSLAVVHHLSSPGRMVIPAGLLSPGTIWTLLLLLAGYFLMDGLRLYCVIRALGYRIAMPCMTKLVFINLFISNITPLATGGGVVQIHYMQGQGMPIGAATAATSIRTILAALILFTLTPIILWLDPELFRRCLNRHLLLLISAVSLMYLVLFWVIVFRIRLIRVTLLAILRLLHRGRFLTRKRMRTLYLGSSRELERCSEGFRRFWRKSGMGWAILSVTSTIFFLLFLFSFSVILLGSLGYHISTLTVLAVQVVVTFFAYFAPTPGGTGVAEGGYGLLFAQMVQLKDLTFLTLAWRFLTIYIGMAVGMGVMARDLMRRSRRFTL